MLKPLTPLRAKGSTRTQRTGRAQKGLSLVELMVGIAVGMFVVAAAATLVSTQLVDNRRLMLEVQVQQDLRATADLITRDLRRIGAFGATSITETDSLVWTANSGSSADDFYSRIILNSINNEVQFYTVRQAGQVGPYGYKSDISPSAGLIRSRLPNTGNWEPLTDSDAMRITAFQLRPIEEPEVMLACPRACPTPASPPAAPYTSANYCWPRLKVRAIEIDITGQSKSDPSIVRRVRSVARLRNDQVVNQAILPSTTPSATQACPS